MLKLIVFGTRSSPLTMAYRATVAGDATVSAGATVAPCQGESCFCATVARGAREFSTGCGETFGVVTTPARGVYCLRSSLVGECSPWPWTRSLAMDALNCSLSLFFMAHFPFEFVEQFHEVEGGGARRAAFHDPLLHRGCFGDADVAVDDRLQHETG